MTIKKLLTVTEVAEWLGAKKFTIYSWVHEHRIPHKKAGRLLRFDEDEIEAWLRTTSVPAKDRQPTRISRMSRARRFRLIISRRLRVRRLGHFFSAKTLKGKQAIGSEKKESPSRQRSTRTVVVISKSSPSRVAVR
jgi:excisionase family DNA binding protein